MATIYKIIGEKDGKYVDIYATGEEELNYWKNNTEVFTAVHHVVEFGTTTKKVEPKKQWGYESSPGIIIKRGL